MKKGGILVTGTDTGVGKTYVTAALVLRARVRGGHAGVMKPVETGCTPSAGGLRARDAEFLIRLTGVDDGENLVCPQRFRAPLAPVTAARLEGRRVSLSSIRRAYARLSRRYDRVFVEGAGGISVPLRRGYTYVDLALDLGLSAVVVARPALGTINHTVLTVNHLTERGVPVLGVIFSKNTPGRLSRAARTSPGVIREETGVRILGTLRYLGRVTAPGLVRAAVGIDQLNGAD